MKIDKTKINGAIVLLENYLDGALADLEQGNIDDIGMVEDCVYVHKLLENELIGIPFICQFPSEYQERLKEIKERVD